MSDNTTCFQAYRFYSSCCLEDTRWNHHSSDFRAVALSTSIIAAILSPVTVAGNALIKIAVWRNHPLKTPSYLLLFGLAFTDLCTGLVTHPVHVAVELIFLKNS